MSKSLLQGVGGGGYRVHDLLLEFVKIGIKSDVDLLEDATERQAQYLRRLDVVKRYESLENGAGSQGFFFLAALWRSVEELSGDRNLEIASYSVSLKELEAFEENAVALRSYSSSIAAFYYFQVRFHVRITTPAISRGDSSPAHRRFQPTSEKNVGLLGRVPYYQCMSQIFRI